MMLFKSLRSAQRAITTSALSQSQHKAPKINHTQLFIDGKFVDSVSGKRFDTIDPSREKVLAQVSEADHRDVDLAVKVARKAFDHGPWPRIGGRQRSSIMLKLAELIKEHANELAQLESIDNGKPLKYASIDVSLTADHFQYFAGWADKIQGKTIPVDGNYLAYTLHEPIGVCGQIIPWNFPLLMAAWKIAPAIASGNTVIVKAAEQTPLSVLRFAQLTLEAGIPPGVVNILTGYGETAGQALATHMDVDKLAFTGSTEVGKLVMAASARSNLKPVTLELGGKSAAIICESADVDKAVEDTHLGLFFNQGQCCCASSRVFVHESIYDEFLVKIKALARTAVLGDPFHEATTQGPQVSEEQLQKILQYIESGKSEGAEVVLGGERFKREGYYVQPTIFSNVLDHMTIAQEEIFGPVMSVLKFSNVEEAVERANKSSYGLAAGVFTKNIDEANTLQRGLRAGTVWINCYDQFDSAIPFGGYKMSGIGREKGEYALQNYLQVKTVQMPLHNPTWL